MFEGLALENAFLGPDGGPPDRGFIALGPDGAPGTKEPRGPVGSDVGAAGLKPLGPAGGCILGEPVDGALNPKLRKEVISAHQIHQL